MLSVRALGNLGASGSDAKQAAHYYSERSADYYVKGAAGDKDQEKKRDESQGQWIGRGAEKIGLKEPPTRDQLQLSLAGHLGGRQVQNAGRENRQMGWDLTFSAPKSVSIAWGFAEPRHRREILEAHQAATKEAFNYIESHTTTRRGYAGHQKEPGYLAAGMFTHHTSRAGDPQLHSHVVVPNFCVRSDGTVGTIESREFYENKLTAGALYQAELSSRMKGLGYEIEAGERGTFRLKTVSPALEKVFSKRGEEIDRVAAEQGIQTYAGTRGVVIATRTPKQYTTMDEREATWRTETQKAGLYATVERGAAKPERLDPQKERALFVTASQKLTDQNSTFEKKDYVRELARASYGTLNAQQILAGTELAQKNGHIMELGSDKKTGRAAFTTAEMSAVEQGMRQSTRELAQQKGYGVDAETSFQKYSFLSDEQKVSVRSATGGSGVVVIQGRAGAGKTTTLEAIRDSYEGAGYKVQGLAFSGQAAQTMQNEARIESRTIASWERNPQMNERTVLIVDEAGMVGSKQMKGILEKAQAAKAKVILVGDERQLQPINAGGALHAVDKELLKVRPEASSQIETIRRQKDEWMRKTIYDAALGRTSDAIEELDQKGKIEIFKNAAGARERVVNDFVDKNAERQKEALILTSRKGDASRINDRVREKLKEKGYIGDDRLKLNNGQRTIGLAVGDRVIMTKNDKRVVVYIVVSGMLQQIDEGSKTLQVKLDNGKNATIPLKTYKHVDYGWASTTHKAQGMTVDRAYVYGHTKEHMASQQVAYVQISRARENTQLYIVNGEKSIERPQPPLETGKEMPAQPLKATSAERKEALDDMKRSWSRDAAKGTSLDYVRDNEQEKQSLDEKRVAPQELLQDREIEQQQKKDESRSAGAEAEKSKEPAVKPDKVRFAGRLARDPEFRAFPEGKAVAELSVVFQRKVKDEQGQWQEKSSVIPVTVRQEQALWARDHLKKGQAILVEGHMRTQERQTAQGPEKQMTVEATKIQDLSQKKDRDMDLER